MTQGMFAFILMFEWDFFGDDSCKYSGKYLFSRAFMSYCSCHSYSQIFILISCTYIFICCRDFHTKSLTRCADPFDEGVTLLLGVRRKPGASMLGTGVGQSSDMASGGANAAGFDGPEEVVTILFDRAQFTEDRAKAWWQINRDRIMNFSR